MSMTAAFCVLGEPQVSGAAGDGCPGAAVVLQWSWKWSCTGAALELEMELQWSWHWSCTGVGTGAALELSGQGCWDIDPQPTPIPRHSRRDEGSSSTQGSRTLPVTEERGAVRSSEHFREDL